MNDNKLFYPETIQEEPFPVSEASVSDNVSQSSSSDEYGNKEIKATGFPQRRIAYEVISSVLNTRSKKILGEFEFTQSGALQIGEYVNGESGDVRISPNGIVARNNAGTTTFALDGTTGNAVFRGEIQAGAVIAGEVVVGNNRVIISVDENGQPSIIINDGTNDRVLLGFGDF